MAELAGDEGARADEGDVAFQDVEKLREFVEGGGAEEAAELRDTWVVRDHVAIRTVFLDEVRFAHFLEGLFGGDAAIFGLHGAELVNREAAVEAGEAGLGVDGGGGGVGELLDDPDDGHRD